jgi:ribosomal subunit interface protein
MEIGESFRARIGEQIQQAVTKYFDGGYSSQVTVEKSGSRFSAACKLHLDTGVVLQANGQANEPQSAFDAASERIEKRLRRYKRKLKDHHNGNGQNCTEVAYRVMDSVPFEDEEQAVRIANDTKYGLAGAVYTAAGTAARFSKSSR